MALHELLDLVLPRECGACRVPGAPWCRRCAGALRAVGFGDGPRRARPEPTPPNFPDTWAWGAYAGPLRPAVTAWKDEGRVDLGAVLAPLLVAAVAAALDGAAWLDGPVLLVPAPSSRRSRRARGEVPLERLAGAAVRQMASRHGPALRLAPRALRSERSLADQSGLGSAARAANLRGALRVDGSWSAVVEGRRCLVVDDVVTTGATLAECARALSDGGARLVVAATIGATPRRAGAQSGRFL